MRIALVDLSAVFRQQWHASENEEFSASFNKTISTITTSVAGYDAVAICADRPPYKRREMYKEYKAQREKAPEAMYEQLRKVEEQLEADGFHIIGSPGYEADDIIGTIVEWTRVLAERHEVVIYSADKDLMQLVDENVSVISTSTRQKYGPAEVVAKWGVVPSLIPDLLALTGDKSDNIPGIAGVGPKTAAEWLNNLGPLDVILRTPEGVPPRFRDAVTAGKDNIALSWRLAQLMTDAPIKPEIILTTKERKVTPQAVLTRISEVEEPEIVEPPRQEPAQVTQLTRQAPQQVAALAPTSWERSLEPRTAAQAWEVAVALHKSRLFGNFPNPEAILAIMMTGRTMGLDTVTSVRSFHLVQGKPCPHAHLLIGLVKKHPECEYFRLVSSSDETATWETKRRDEPEPVSMTYTIDQARTAGLVSNDNWKKRPDEMIRKTAGVQLARAVYPDVTMGLYSVEEMQDAA